MTACRCGWDGPKTGEHLCHGCGVLPGKRFFYEPNPMYSLAGVQIKFSVTESFGCDGCRREFTEKMARSRR